MKSAKLKSMLLSALLFVNCEGESIRNFTKVFNLLQSMDLLWERSGMLNESQLKDQSFLTKVMKRYPIPKEKLMF